MAESLRHICGISGGKDSSALAVYLRDRVPDMEYFFCDTGAELPETYEYLTRLEVILAQPIARLNASRGLRPLVRGVPGGPSIASDALVHQEHEDQADRGVDRRRAGGVVRGDPGGRVKPEGLCLHQVQHHDQVPVRGGR